MFFSKPKLEIVPLFRKVADDAYLMFAHERIFAGASLYNSETIAFANRLMVAGLKGDAPDNFERSELSVGLPHGNAIWCDHLTQKEAHAFVEIFGLTFCHSRITYVIPMSLIREKRDLIERRVMEKIFARQK